MCCPLEMTEEADAATTGAALEQHALSWFSGVAHPHLRFVESAALVGNSVWQMLQACEPAMRVGLTLSLVRITTFIVFLNDTCMLI
jgi:hypothetical protein